MPCSAATARCSTRNEASREAHREYRCGRCQRVVSICRFCDRGQRYCGPTCSSLARRESQREASRRYQQTEEGRRNHAARQNNYERRRRETLARQDVEQSGVPLKKRVGRMRKSSRRQRARIGASTCCWCQRHVSGWVRMSFISNRSGPLLSRGAGHANRQA